MASSMASSTNQTDVDELFDIRNAYYIGNFQQCINEAQRIKISTAEQKLEKDVYLYLAYIAQQKYPIVKSEINDRSPAELQALKFLAEFFSTSIPQREVVLSKFNDKFGSETTNHYVLFTGATMYYHQNQCDKALQLIFADDHLESQSLALQIYISMNRYDLATKQLKKMQEKEEDSTLTQLGQAWVNIAMGRGKPLEEAFYIVQEIIDKYGSTISLSNCLAICFISQGKYEEADAVISEALEKDDSNCISLANAIVLSAFIKKKDEVINRYFTQLKGSYPNSVFVRNYEEKEREFDELCKEYAAKV